MSEQAYRIILAKHWVGHVGLSPSILGDVPISCPPLKRPTVKDPVLITNGNSTSECRGICFKGWDMIYFYICIYIYMCTLSTLKCWPCMAILVSFKTPTSNLCFLLLLNLWPPKKLHINLFHLVAQKGLNRFKVACGRNVPLMDCGFEKGGS